MTHKKAVAKTLAETKTNLAEKWERLLKVAKSKGKRQHCKTKARKYRHEAGTS